MKNSLTSFLAVALVGWMTVVVVTPALAQSGTKPAATAAQSQATPPGPLRTPAQMVDDFFTQLKMNSVDAAYAQLLQGSKIADVPGDVATLKTKTREAIQAFGDILGYDLLWTKNVGTHLMCATYVSAGKNYPIRWRFYFYRASDTWKLIDIRIDDRLMAMFDEPVPSSIPIPSSQQ